MSEQDEKEQGQRELDERKRRDRETDERRLEEQRRGEKREPFAEHGFWWWWDPALRDYRVGCSPSVSKPAWAA